MKFLLVPGGSPAGLSYWSSVLPCPLAHWYRYHDQEKVESWGSGKEATGKMSATMLGTLVHAYLEVWYGQRVLAPLDFVDNLTGQPLVGFRHEEAEAWAIAQAYVRQYQHVDRVDEVECEVDVEDTSGDLGVPRLTARLDMVSFWEGNERWPAGRYIWEHKTASASSSHLLAEHSNQCRANIYLWNKQNPDRPVLGAIINNIIKTKTPKFERELVLPPTEKDIENLTRTLTFVYGIHEQHSQQMVASRTSCMGKYSPCSFYQKCHGA